MATATELSFTQEPQDVVAIKNSDLLLNCSAASSNQGQHINITWWKDGEQVNDARRYVLANGSLFIRRVKHKVARGRSDEGTYVCQARNQLGTIVSREAQVHIASQYSLLQTVVSSIQSRF